MVNKEDIIEDVKKMYFDEEKSSYKIAEIYSVSRCFITTLLKKNGYKLRKGGNKKGYVPWNKGKPYYAIRGKNNGNWKGGVTSLNQQLRHCIEYKNWTKEILKRDNWTCKFCKKRGGDLQADHYPKCFAEIREEYNIKSYKEAQDCKELWDINNGRTLCIKCHKKTFKFMGNQFISRTHK